MAKPADVAPPRGTRALASTILDALGRVPEINRRAAFKRASAAVKAAPAAQAEDKAAASPAPTRAKRAAAAPATETALTRRGAEIAAVRRAGSVR